MTTSNRLETGESADKPTTGRPTSWPEGEGFLATERGEDVCVECDLIVDEYRLDHGPDSRRRADPEYNHQRTGAPLTPSRHDRGLSTEIGRSVDGKGGVLTGRRRLEFGRLRRQHYRARYRSKAERNLSHGFTEINRIRGALDLPRSVHDRACVVFREAQVANLLLGRSIESMTAGCVNATCREQRWLRTLEEVASVAACDPSAVRNAYRVVHVELGIEVPPRRPEDLISRLATAVGVSTDARTRSLTFAEAAIQTGLDNVRNPAGVAAACLYVAAAEFGPSKTQVELAEAAGVTPSTIRVHARALSKVTN